MANEAVIVHKGRVNVIPVSLGFDVSGDTITSDIKTATGVVIASWVVTFDSTGEDGEIILTMDDSISGPITYDRGVMDLKRVSGGQPYAVFDAPLDVEFRDTVTT